jgi:hypothetical protein
MDAFKNCLEQIRIAPYIVLKRRLTLISVLNWWVTIFLEKRNGLDFREVSRADRLEPSRLSAHHLSVSAGTARGASRYFGTKSNGLLRSVPRYLRARHSANRRRRRFVSPDLYLPYVGHYSVLGGLGLAFRRRSYDRFFAWISSSLSCPGHSSLGDFSSTRVWHDLGDHLQHRIASRRGAYDTYRLA